MVLGRSVEVDSGRLAEIVYRHGSCAAIARQRSSESGKYSCATPGVAPVALNGVQGGIVADDGAALVYSASHAVRGPRRIEHGDVARLVPYKSMIAAFLALIPSRDDVVIVDGGGPSAINPASVRYVKDFDEARFVSHKSAVRVRALHEKKPAIAPEAFIPATDVPAD